VQLGFFLGFPIALQVILDEAIGKGDLRMLSITLGILGGGFILTAAAAASQDYLAGRTVADQMMRLRQGIYDRLLHAGPDFYRNTATGEILSRFSNDLNAMEQGLARLLGSGLYSALLFIGSTVLLFVIEWRLAVLTCAGLPLVYLGPQIFGRRAGQYSRLRKEQEAALTAFLQESISGHAIVRGFRLESLMHSRFMERAVRLHKSSIGTAFFGALIGRTANLLIFFLILVIIGVSAYLTMKDWLTIGAMFAFLGILANIGDAGLALSDAAPVLVQATTGVQRVYELLEEANREEPTEAPLEMRPLKSAISFTNVTFGYRPEALNLHEVNLTIHRGEAVAVVGASGSGKSTMLHLLTGACLPQKGSITYDGVDLQKIDFDSLRRQVVVVDQEPFLFDTTLRENIRLGRLEAGDAEVEAAAVMAGLHEAIMQLPDGYDTRVGEGGRNLSGGQRQRVALARAILRRPAVLLLDEVTSALDPITEAAINATLADLAGRYTLISVTHRLSAVSAMDRILVLDGKGVAEQGNHAELLARGGLYARLWQKQSGFEFNADGHWAIIDRARLRQAPLLAELPDDLLDDLISHLTTVHFDPGADVIVQGRPGERFFIIVCGSVRVIDCSDPPRERELTVLEVGDYFGEISLYLNVPATATVRARSRCTCLALSREHFQSLLERAPQVRESIRLLAEQRLAKTPGAGSSSAGGI
jgi:ATP-binding cassette subfamily B protein